MLTNHNVLHTLAYLENRQGGGGKLKRAPSQLDEGAMSMLEGRGRGGVCSAFFKQILSMQRHRNNGKYVKYRENVVSTHCITLLQSTN